MNEVLLSIMNKYKDTRRKRDFLKEIDEYVDKHYLDSDFNAEDVRKVLKLMYK